MKQYLKLNREVHEAKETGKPVVALESTIISHGMPYPANIEMAKKVEQIIRDGEAVPATIAVMDGMLKVGLEEEDLERLAKSEDVAKVSKRDIPVLIANKKLGATTVAATMVIAHMAGIKVFVTGGIGGVHRGAETSFDISADLEELFLTPCTVVCAGVKSILDIGLTLEYLETKGVPVIGANTYEFPAFFTSKSGFQTNYSMNAQEIAETIFVKDALQLPGGVLVANPIPKEYEADPVMIETAIKNALNSAEQEGIKGKDVTPYLLAAINELTAGKSLEANLNLVYNNARVGAEIAFNLSKLS